jgi:CubicO group peptidase (beta-lactamase class C family)
MHPVARLAALTLVLFPALLPALDASKLGAIHPAMESAVKAKQAAGIVTLVMEKGKIVHHDAAGMADVAKGRAMEKDALFWIASMTKSINATAVMVLVDEGKLALDEPASKWLPELANVKLADGSAPQKPITLRMLLSHTAGIAFPSRKPTDGGDLAQGLRRHLDQDAARLPARQCLRIRLRPHGGRTHPRNRLRHEV